MAKVKTMTLIPLAGLINKIDWPRSTLFDNGYISRISVVVSLFTPRCQMHCRHVAGISGFTKEFDLICYVGINGLLKFLHYSESLVQKPNSVRTPMIWLGL